MPPTMTREKKPVDSGLAAQNNQSTERVLARVREFLDGRDFAEVRITKADNIIDLHLTDKTRYNW